MSGRVPPSSRAGQSQRVVRERFKATDPDVLAAADLYERFTGHKAEGVGTIPLPRMPRVGVLIGDIDGVLYTTVRDGKTEKYIHQFHRDDKPAFVVSPDGKQLFLIGGAYDFTERGIVDRSDKSR